MSRSTAFSCLLALVVIAAAIPGTFAQPAGLEERTDRVVRDVEDGEQAQGDLDRDGDTDLVVARRQGLADEAPHVLFLNTNGILIDRTGDRVAGPGSEPSTGGRHVRVADMNNDGWLDLISSQAPGSARQSGGSYPWVYLNQCCSVGGCDATSCSTENWLGLRFENDRIPEMLTGGKPRK